MKDDKADNTSPNGSTSNPEIRCCILDLPCCRPPGTQVDAVMLKMAHGILGDTYMPRRLKIEDIREMDWYQTVRAGVEELLSEYGLVPRSVASAIRDGYAEFMQSTSSKSKEHKEQS